MSEDNTTPEKVEQAATPTEQQPKPQKTYSAVQVVINIVIGVLVGFISGYVLKPETEIMNPNLPASHLLISTITGFILVALNQKVLSKLAYIVLPIVYIILSPFAFAIAVFASAMMGIEQGSPLFIVSQYLPLIIMGYLSYVLYASVARKRSFLVAILTILFFTAIGALIPQGVFGDGELLYMALIGGTYGIFSLLHLGKNT